MAHKKFDPSRRERLDRPERSKEYDIPSIVSTIGLKPGMVVADIGAGTGFFSIPFSEAVGKAGKVLAIDISPEMLDSIKEKVRKMKLSNVLTVASVEDSIPIQDYSVDLAFMANVFHELDGDGTMLELMRILKPGGRFAVLDWKKRHEDVGPPYRHRLNPMTVIKRCARLGLVFAGEFPTGSDRRYGLLFVKPDSQT